MSITLEPPPIPLTMTPEGVLRISGTRVPLDTVVRAFQQGANPEEIAQDYPLTLAEIYAVLAYYLWHREAVEDYMAERATMSAQARQSVESRTDLGGIRSRLLARQREQEHAA